MVTANTVETHSLNDQVYNHTVSEREYKKGTSGAYSTYPQPLLIDDDFQSVSGDIVFDRFRVADVCMEEFKFGIVTKARVNPKLPNGVDGVLGLSRSVTYDQFGRTLLESMHADRKIEEKVFGIKLCPNDNPELATGHMTFGGLCSDCYGGEFSDFRLTTSERWCMDFGSLRFGGKLIHGESMTACMDIRQAFIRGPNQLIDAINQQLSGGQYVDGVYQVPCSKRDSYPPVTFVSGRYRLTLTWKQYIIQRKENRCFSVFRGSSRSGMDWKFGLPVHRYFYVLYDYDRSLIRFADAACS
ncbi:aspartic proteinase precursor [Clonorchis sinensis]|uniref:Aspartic proteinase n=1 Tax=Clonorchis sinensis TaxID=79923 RepID=A0A3R7ES31_CLOSI|nr:aspartic proteinase precursor [Clonorchis sinensis]